MKLKEHTRNQKRMYRIHKQEEKIQNLELLVGKLQQENQQLKEIINAAKTRISIIRMDNDTTEDTHKALDYILEILLKGVQE